jgi:hypothetical protein
MCVHGSSRKLRTRFHDIQLYPTDLEIGNLPKFLQEHVRLRKIISFCNSKIRRTTEREIHVKWSVVKEIDAKSGFGHRQMTNGYWLKKTSEYDEHSASNLEDGFDLTLLG